MNDVCVCECVCVSVCVSVYVSVCVSVCKGVSVCFDREQIEMNFSFVSRRQEENKTFGIELTNYLKKDSNLPSIVLLVV
jgi:hypothetical protein